LADRMKADSGPSTSRLPASRRRLAEVAVALIVLGGLAAVQASPERPPAKGAEIHGLQVENTPSDLFVSFALRGAFTPEIREQLDSGLPITFNHYVEIVHRRAAWFDSTRVEKVISTTATYDTLTRQYRLTRSVNGQMVETSLSDKAAEMERFMTEVERQRICDPTDLEGDRSLVLRVKSRVQKRFVLFFIPWNFETSWARIRLTVPVEAADAPQEPPREPPAP